MYIKPPGEKINMQIDTCILVIVHIISGSNKSSESLISLQDVYEPYFIAVQ